MYVHMYAQYPRVFIKFHVKRNKSDILIKKVSLHKSVSHETFEDDRYKVGEL